MHPFYEPPSDPDWDLLEVVADCMHELSDNDQEALYGIFYDRTTYEQLADTLGIKAKSHAWRRTQQALENLKNKLLEHPAFKNRSQYDD